MRSAWFKHSCVITRISGYDPVTGDDVTEEIYDGSCLYEEGSNAVVAYEIVQASPNLYLPDNDAIFKSNDVVVATINKGRQITAKIDGFRDLDGRNVRGTKIMLKESRDV